MFYGSKNLLLQFALHPPPASSRWQSSSCEVWSLTGHSRSSCCLRCSSPPCPSCCGTHAPPAGSGPRAPSGCLAWPPGSQRSSRRGGCCRCCRCCSRSRGRGGRGCPLHPPGTGWAPPGSTGPPAPPPPSWFLFWSWFVMNCSACAAWLCSRPRPGALLGLECNALNQAQTLGIGHTTASTGTLLTNTSSQHQPGQRRRAWQAQRSWFRICNLTQFGAGWCNVVSGAGLESPPLRVAILGFWHQPQIGAEILPLKNGSRLHNNTSSNKHSWSQDVNQADFTIIIYSGPLGL